MTPLENKHTFGLPTRARKLVQVRSVCDLENVRWNEDSWILGAGSNTLFTQDYQGEILHNCLRGADIEEGPSATLLHLAAGENWHHWVVSTVTKGIGGLENLALIPGTVGAAPVQNIGAYGVEISRFIEKVAVYDLIEHKAFALSAEECQFSYRNSIFKQAQRRGWFITRVTLALPKNWSGILDYPDLELLPASSSALTIMNKVIEVRQRKLPDPLMVPNAGSFFKNPEITNEALQQLTQKYPEMPYYPLAGGGAKLAAGWLIEQAGMKSLRVGGAAVHPRQALVLVNSGCATGEEVIQLAREIVAGVQQRFAVQLEPEVRILGSCGPVTL